MTDQQIIEKLQEHIRGRDQRIAELEAALKTIADTLPVIPDSVATGGDSVLLRIRRIVIDALKGGE